jgi:hypothetical protein
MECASISDFFVALENDLPARAADVLEHFFVDSSMGQGLVVPKGYDACADLLSAHVSTARYPPEAFRLALPKHADYFVYGPSDVGGQGITAKRHIPKGTFFCYEGLLQKEVEANGYTLAVGAVSTPPGRPDQVVYIDGSVTSRSLIGGMNEFIWDGMMNQFEFGDAGLVRALRDVPKGTVC